MKYLKRIEKRVSHYGREWGGEGTKYNVASIEDEVFKDEITITTEFSIAKREDIGHTNAYYCPECGSWIANNRLLGQSVCVHEDERVLEC